MRKRSGGFDLFAFFKRYRPGRKRTDSLVFMTESDSQQSFEMTESSLPRNRLPSKGNPPSEPIELPANGDEGYDEGYDEEYDGYGYDEGYESGDCCDGQCGPDLFFLFLGKRRHIHDCHEYYEDDSIDGNDVDNALPLDLAEAPTKITPPPGTLPLGNDADR